MLGYNSKEKLRVLGLFVLLITLVLGLIIASTYIFIDSLEKLSEIGLKTIVEDIWNPN